MIQSILSLYCLIGLGVCARHVHEGEFDPLIREVEANYPESIFRIVALPLVFALVIVIAWPLIVAKGLK